jgi:geranylgeranyl pyrophosphate synthase
MSHYAVNAGVPKTLVSELIRWAADTLFAKETAVAAALRDVLAHHGSMIRAQLAYALLAGGTVDTLPSLAMPPAERAQTGAGSQGAVGTTPRELGAFGAADGASPVRYSDRLPAADAWSGVAVRVAIALEYFHAASLLFDDLPAMDDAALRRGRPCPHRVWGEGVAILAALALVNRAYELVWSAIGPLPRRRRDEAGALVGSCLGVDGILGGQARDLRFAGAPQSEDEAVAIADGKTVSLIRLTLVLPAIVAGAPRATRDRLAVLARWWGLSYQILDDFRDELAGAGETGKSGHRDQVLGRPNHPRLAGARLAFRNLRDHLAAARSTLERFPPSYPPAAVVWRVQAFLEREASRVRAALDAVSPR